MMEIEIDPKPDRGFSTSCDQKLAEAESQLEILELKLQLLTKEYEEKYDEVGRLNFCRERHSYTHSLLLVENDESLCFVISFQSPSTFRRCLHVLMSRFKTMMGNYLMHRLDYPLL